VVVASLDDAREGAQSGFARLPWDLLGEGEGEARLLESSVSVRCLQRADGSVPASRDEPDLVAVVGRSY
jgi:prolyl-tRNA synthetase